MLLMDTQLEPLIKVTELYQTTATTWGPNIPLRDAIYLLSQNLRGRGLFHSHL